MTNDGKKAIRSYVFECGVVKVEMHEDAATWQNLVFMLSMSLKIAQDSVVKITGVSETNPQKRPRFGGLFRRREKIPEKPHHDGVLRLVVNNEGV